MLTPDLLSLSIPLSPLAAPSRQLPAWWGRGAHALLLKAVRSVDAELSAAIHEPGETRPFTVSTLLGRFPDRGLDPAGAYRLRFTALTGAMAQALLQAGAPGGLLAPGSRVELDGLPFEITDQPAGERPQSASYTDLAAEALPGEQPEAKTVSLRFLSPTNFTSGGRLSSNGHNVPFPLPDFVFGSLLERWNAFSPVAFPAELRRYAAECLHVSRFEISSRAASVAGGMQVGMVGVVVYKAHQYDRYWMSLVQTLARYAFFAGVGAKTTMGLGQCQVIACSGRENPGSRSS